jgi:hypothetical protein
VLVNKLGQIILSMIWRFEMKKFKRFKQSYRDTINPTIAYFKESCCWPNGRIAYGLNLGEMFEWANDCYSTRWLYKESIS